MMNIINLFLYLSLYFINTNGNTIELKIMQNAQCMVADYENGDIIKMVTCGDWATTNNRWYYNINDKTIKNAQTGKCLHVRVGDWEINKNDGVVIVFDCEGDKGYQKWDLHPTTTEFGTDAYYITSDGKNYYCLNVDYENGGRLNMYRCDPNQISDNKKFELWEKY